MRKLTATALRLFLAFLIITMDLAVAPRASAVNIPIWPNNCATAATNFGTTASTQSCVLNNVVSGRTVLIAASSQSTSASVTASGGETVTCPAGAVGLFGAGAIRVQLCYIVLGSSHATLTITNASSGGTNQVEDLIASEMQGVGSVDASSASGANATSVSTTTAGSNEIVFEACRGFSNDIAPGSGFSQIGFANATTTATQDSRTFFGYQIVSAASTITTACTITGGTSSNVIAALAFSVSGAPAPPAIGLVQWCQLNAPQTSATSTLCPLHNTVSGNKVLTASVQSNNAVPITINCTGTETCVCPSNSQTLSSNVYAGLFVVLGLCYADTTSGHATFTTTASNNSGAGTTHHQWVQEVSGLLTSIDSGSEANAVAATVNYTTANANEWTFCYAADNNANPMAPASSFSAIGQAEGVITPTQQTLVMAKTTVSSGSNTCSYSITSGTQPLIATFSFGPTVTGASGYPMVF